MGSSGPLEKPRHSRLTQKQLSRPEELIRSAESRRLCKEDAGGLCWRGRADALRPGLQSATGPFSIESIAKESTQ